MSAPDTVREVRAAGGALPRPEAARPRSGWRLLRDGPADGATNMAIDHALLESVRDGAPPILRLYRWDPATLSFGRNQPARDLYDRDAARERGIGFVRRPTGGQAVLHDDELTYAVMAPVAVIGRPREAYRTINAALVAGLRLLGLPASLAEEAGVAPGPRSRAQGPQPLQRAPARSPAPGRGSWMAACFRQPAAGEVVVRGRKLVGSAQRCEGRVILQHGSILLGGSQSAAEELLVGAGADRARGGAGWTTIEAELGGRPPLDELVAALAGGWADVIGTALAPAALAVRESSRAGELRAQFASPEWTWRR